jgi:hypothetical protein
VSFHVLRHSACSEVCRSFGSKGESRDSGRRDGSRLGSRGDRGFAGERKESTGASSFNGAVARERRKSLINRLTELRWKSESLHDREIEELFGK